MSMEPTTERSPTRYVWLQLAVLGVGIAALVLAHTATQRMDDAVTGATVPTLVVLLVVVPLALAAVARSTYVIVTSGYSDAYRIFRSRHLFTSGTLLFVVAAAGTVAMVVHDPFDKLFAHGRITGEDIVDVGIMFAAVICMVGAGVAFTGAWDRLHAERHWHRSLHLHDRRQV
jgi:uncharacterized membrane protein YidH (DUF202 family)